MACWYLAVGLELLPTDIPTKWPDVSTRIANADEPPKTEIGFIYRDKVIFGEL
jgi:hypothetical protein